MNNQIWYAVMNGSIADNDWGTGSYDISEAKRRCRDFNDEYEESTGGRYWYIEAVENGIMVTKYDENGNEI